ncbi:MAG: DegV family protein, partial [Anaerolineales bacterium]|nr:DegV family protein [Anaerolineales bacterium]
RHHAPGSALHVQVLYSFNPEGAQKLRDKIAAVYECHWLPMGPMSLVLGAHTGPSMVGVAYAPQALFSEPFS